MIGLGSGMPQVFNDESIIPALEAQGIAPADAVNYAIVGCVELTTHGNNLGWSDAAMFNLVKALELAMNDGKCLLTGAQLGPQTGYLTDFATYEDLERAFAVQIDYFFEKMIEACEKVEEIHQRLLPTGAPLVGHRRLPRPRPRRHPRRRALQPVRHPGHPGRPTSPTAWRR